MFQFQHKPPLKLVLLVIEWGKNTKEGEFSSLSLILGEIF
jgi:hypothetical protein